MKKKTLLIFIFIFLITFATSVYADCTLEYTTCGSGDNEVIGIPTFVPRLISFFVMFLQIIIPVVLIVTGMIEMMKSVSSGNPDNITKGRLKLIKKFVAALFAFLVITFTTNIIKLIADSSEKNTFVACMSCYLNNQCGNTYCEDGDVGYDDILGSQYKDSCIQYTKKKECNEGRTKQGNMCEWANGTCQELNVKASCLYYDVNNCNGKKDKNGNDCWVNPNGAQPHCDTKK